MTKMCSILAALLVCIFTTAGAALAAQTIPATTGPVSTFSGASVQLAGHTPRQVLDGTAIRVGHYNPAQKLRLAIFVHRPNPAGEEKFLTELQTKGSPNFHKFLTAEEWNARFGPSAEDEQKIVDWATSQGLTVTNRYANRMIVDVEAPAGVIEKALGVTINNYQVGEEVDFANDSDPAIPARLSGVLSSIAGLNSIHRFHSAHTSSSTKKGPDYVAGPVYTASRSSQGEGDPSKSPQGRLAAVAQSYSPAASHATEAPAVSLDNGYADPANIFSSEAYDYDALYNLGHCCNVHNDTNGSPNDTSFALVTFGDFLDGDVATFFQQYGMAWNYNVYVIDGTSGMPGKECNRGSSGCHQDGLDDEAPLDVEYSIASANSFGSVQDTAHAYVYEGANGLDNTFADLYNFILSDNHARVVSTSYGGSEPTSGSEVSNDTGTAPGDMHGIFNSMVGQGITLISASGDQGPTDGCQDRDAVLWPASDPDFVAAGGTMLKLNKDGTWASEVAWTGGTTAKNCSSNGGGGGGGISSLFSEPSWQNGITYEEMDNGNDYIVSNSPRRLLPDLSLEASGPAWQWYYCSANACICDSNGQNCNIDKAWKLVGGTSIVAPELAGFFTQENAYLNYIGHICGSKGTDRCEPIGNPNWILYGEGQNPSAPHYPFYDITSGCVTNYYTAKDPSLLYFCATDGYDLATGWGSANMLQLAWAINWDIIPADGAPKVKFNGPATNVWYNSNQSVSWTLSDGVRSGSTTPAPGVAGFTQGWDWIPSDSYSMPHGGTGDSFYSGPQFPNATKGCLALDSTNTTCSNNGGVQGCHTVHVMGWDNQGNSTGDQTYGPLCYDTTPPTVTVSSNPAANAKGWNNSSVTVTLTSIDRGGSDASGIYATYYAVDNLAAGPCNTKNLSACTYYTNPLVISKAGQHWINYFAKDKAGNFSAIATEYVNIDETAPVTKASFAPAANSAGWNNSTVTVTLSATDAASGVAKTYYWLDNPVCFSKPILGSAVCHAYSSPFAITADGKHTVYFQSVDKAGNSEAVKKLTVNLDQTAPITVATPSPAPIVAGWNRSTVTVTLSATDALSGVAKTIYWLDSPACHDILIVGSALCKTYSTPFTISAEGKHTVYFESVDKAGNVETAKTLAVNIDETAPVTKLGLNGTLVGSIYQSAVTVTLTATDSLSGVNGTYYSLDGKANVTYAVPFKITTPGSHTLKFLSVDNADNTETAKSGAFTIVSPTTIALSVSPNPSVNGQKVILTATVVATLGSTPTGNVNFVNGATKLGTGTLSGGVATLTTTALAVGSHTLKAVYAGATSDLGSSSATVTQVVHETTTTAVASSPNPAAYGQPVTFTARVTASISGTPTGRVQFMDGATNIGSPVALSASGVAPLAIATLGSGSHSITAVYSGDATYAASTSVALTQTVNPVVTAGSVVWVPDYYGQLLQVRVGTGTAITINLPSCNPNAVAVNSNKAYVVCNASGANPDKILVYNAATIRAAATGTLTISPTQTITSAQFKSLIGVTFDASNNLWVASYGNNQVDEITAATLLTATPAVVASLVESPSSPVALAFDKNGSLWVTGQYGGGILLNFLSSQFGQGKNANPDYCLATTNLSGCQYVNGVFLDPEGLALFGGDVWVANNSSGATGTVPGRELIDLKYSGGSATAMGTLTVHATYGKSGVAADNPLVCPGGLFAGSVHLWVNDESYGETNPGCGAAGDVASKTGGVFDFTAAQLAAQTTNAAQVLAYANITGRPGFGGIYVENDQ